jgi:hypothetical protein
MDSMLQWKKPGKRREMPEIRYSIIFASSNPYTDSSAQTQFIKCLKRVRQTEFKERCREKMSKEIILLLS